MTKAEILRAICDKEAKAKELRAQIKKSNSAIEVRSLGDTLDKIVEELAELEEKLSDANGEKSETWVENENVSRGLDFNYMNTVNTRSFSQGAGTVPEVENSNGYILRSNETMVSRVPQSERKPIDLGKYVRGAVTGNWDGATEERDAFSTTANGVVIPQVVSAKVIDLARNLSLFTSAGVPVVPMDTNNMTIGRVSSDPEFAFKEELAEAGENDFSLDGVELKAKTCYGYAYVSLELINSASNLTEILYQAFSQAMASSIDKGMLYGQNGAKYAPAGIMNDKDINHIPASNVRYNDFVKAIGAIKRENGVPTVVAMNAGTEEQLALLYDANGNVLAEPKAFEGLTKIVSNQLVEDAEKGSDALVFDPNAMLVGMQKNIVFRMFQDTDYCIKNGAVGFQIYSMLDAVAIKPKHVAKITGIKDVVAVETA